MKIPSFSSNKEYCVFESAMLLVTKIKRKRPKSFCFSLFKNSLYVILRVAGGAVTKLILVTPLPNLVTPLPIFPKKVFKSFDFIYILSDASRRPEYLFLWCYLRELFLDFSKKRPAIFVIEK